MACWRVLRHGTQAQVGLCPTRQDGHAWAARLGEAFYFEECAVPHNARRVCYDCRQEECGCAVLEAPFTCVMKGVHRLQAGVVEGCVCRHYDSFWMYVLPRVPPDPPPRPSVAQECVHQ